MPWHKQNDLKPSISIDISFLQGDIVHCQLDICKSQFDIPNEQGLKRNS